MTKIFAMQTIRQGNFAKNYAMQFLDLHAMCDEKEEIQFFISSSKKFIFPIIKHENEPFFRDIFQITHTRLLTSFFT